MHCIYYELEISRENILVAILRRAKSAKIFNFENFRVHSKIDNLLIFKHLVLTCTIVLMNVPGLL